MPSPIDDGEYAAIKIIHKQLDDNADGSVDFSESAEVSVCACQRECVCDPQVKGKSCQCNFD